MILRNSARRADDLLRIGLFWPTSRTQIPCGYVAQQNPDVLDVEWQRRMARETESVGFDFVLLADSYSPNSAASSQIGHLDPSTHSIPWSWLVLGETTTLGVIATMHTTFIPPADIASFGAQLDSMSNGRFGWNITTGYRESEPALFGGDGLADHDERYDMAEECIEVVLDLWTADAPTVHHGRYRRCEGFLEGPPPVQRPGPILVNAGASDRGMHTAARYCDYVFTSVPDYAQVPRLTAKLAKFAHESGRDASPEVLVLVTTLLRDASGEARAEMRRVNEATAAESEAALAFYRRFAEGSESFAKSAARAGDNSKVTDPTKVTRAVYSPPLLGRPTDVAEEVITIYREHDVRGFLFSMPYFWWDDLAKYAELFDELHRAGVWRPARERESLW
ncbi:MAG: LLM class flavin-dependent oxidoreductase [Microbacterium sp.]